MKNMRKNICRNRIPFCRDLDYCNMEKLVETEEELRKKDLCCDKVIYVVTLKEVFFRDKVIYVATLKEEESLVDTNKQSRDM